MGNTSLVGAMIRRPVLCILWFQHLSQSGPNFIVSYFVYFRSRIVLSKIRSSTLTLVCSNCCTRSTIVSQISRVASLGPVAG